VHPTSGHDFNVVGSVGDGRALLRSAGILKPDVIVLDIAMPVLNGLEAGRQVKQMLPAVKLVYLTMNSDAQVAAEAFASGASGFLLKTCAASELVLAVRQALRDKIYLYKTLSRDAINSLRWEHKKQINEDERPMHGVSWTCKLLFVIGLATLLRQGSSDLF